MSPNAEGVCWACGTQLHAADYPREGSCVSCRKQTHVCRNCQFFEPGLANDCREPIAERVNDKDRANFCDYFEPTQSAYHPKTDAKALKSAADDLFDI